MNIKKSFNSFLDAIFPTGVTCLYCGKETDSDVNGLCYECASALRQNGKFGEEYDEVTVYSAFLYDGLARKIILKAKDSDSPHLTRTMAKYVAELYKIVGKKCDLIVYVPCSGKNLRKRGYDHMKNTAKFLSDETGVPTVKALKRTGKSKDQTEVRNEERKRNVENAFIGINAEKIKGKTVLIIDDVVTTGATLNACAKVLRKAQPKEVVCFTFAKA